MTRRKKILAGLVLALAALVVGAWEFPDGSTVETGPWRAFDEAWFRAHQRDLLYLLNAPTTRAAARWAFCIHDYDCPPTERIAAIGPNRFTYGVRRLTDGRVEAVTDFRADPKFSRRVYRIGKPLWWLAHLADKALDRWAPAQSFGLSTLTVYPDPSPGVTTKSGYVDSHDSSGSGRTFAQLLAGGGGVLYVYTTPCLVNISTGYNTNTWSSICRSECLFKTSTLTSSAVVSAATLSAYCQATSDPGSASPNVDIYTAAPASNTTMQTGDFLAVGSTSQTGSPNSYSSFTASAYSAFPFNGTGIGNISTTGISKFALRNANYDAAATPPSWGNSWSYYIQFASADAAGTANDPKLVVTYTLSSGFDALQLSGD